MTNNDSITYFSENIFDRNIYTKSEIKTMVKNLIKTINLFDFGNADGSTIEKLKHFGIVNSDQEYDTLATYLGKSLYQKLLSAFSKIDEETIYKEYLDIAKYSQRYREAASDDL